MPDARIVVAVHRGGNRNPYYKRGDAIRCCLFEDRYKFGKKARKVFAFVTIEDAEIVATLRAKKDAGEPHPMMDYGSEYELAMNGPSNHSGVPALVRKRKRASSVTFDLRSVRPDKRAVMDDEKKNSPILDLTDAPMSKKPKAVRDGR